jgi:hypothetical protein
MTTAATTWSFPRLAGLSAPLVYIVTVIVGAAMSAGYSHLADPISSLTAVSGPGQAPSLIGLTIYNTLLAIFAAAAMLAARDRLTFALYGLLGVVALSGGSLLVFPTDLPGTPMTPSGWVHVSLAAITSLATMVAVAISAVQWRREGRALLAQFAVIDLVVILVSGIAAAAAAAAGWTFMGLLERVTIGGFLAWVAVLAWSGSDVDVTARA